MTTKSTDVIAWLIVAGAAMAIATAPIAAASTDLPTPGAGPASEAIDQLQAQGFTVSINWLEGHPNVPLRECHITSVNDPSRSVDDPALTTVYVDVACPNAK
ncbi:hypothetical protein [Mycobacterium sp. MMS18-G62]